MGWTGLFLFCIWSEWWCILVTTGFLYFLRNWKLVTFHMQSLNFNILFFFQKLCTGSGWLSVVEKRVARSFKGIFDWPYKWRGGTFFHIWCKLTTKHMAVLLFFIIYDTYKKDNISWRNEHKSQINFKWDWRNVILLQNTCIKEYPRL